MVPGSSPGGPTKKKTISIYLLVVFCILGMYPCLMATKKLSEALLFIDTNILLDFYRVEGRGSGLELLDLIDKHNSSIITTSQVEMEFKKNRQSVILKSMDGSKLPDIKSINTPAFLVESKQNNAVEKKHREIKLLHVKILNRIEVILKDPIRKDPVYKTLQRLFKVRTPFNLNRDDDTRFEIRELANKRYMLGYPPRKSGDTSIGDAINWEWIIRVAKEHKKNVVIVTRDSDYGHREHINDWLRQEFKQRVSNKKDVYLTNKLSKAFQMISVPVSDKVVTAEDELVERAAEVLVTGIGASTAVGNVIVTTT